MTGHRCNLRCHRPAHCGGDTAPMAGSDARSLPRTRWVRIGTVVVLAGLSLAACGRKAEESLPAPATLTVLPAPDAPPEPAAARPMPPTTRVPVTTTSLPNSVTYTVQDGDTFFGIADKFGITPQLLAGLNPLKDPGRLVVGQLLIVPGPAPVPGSPDGSATATTTGTTVTVSTLPSATKNG